MNGLPILVRLDGAPVIILGDGETATAKRRLVERAGGKAVAAENESARLAIVAIEDEAEARQAIAILKERGLLVNAVDRPALCDFTLPAIVDRTPVLVAISTGGASAGLAAALRQRIETLLPARLGALATSLHGARERLRARWPDPAARRHAIGEALDAGGALDPLDPDTDVAAITDWIEADDAHGRPDRLVRLELASPDPDELTLRAARLLARADTVYHREDVPTAILDRARADAPRIRIDTPPTLSRPGLSVDLTMAR